MYKGNDKGPEVYKSKGDNVEIDITKGTIIRTAKATLGYEGKEKPSIKAKIKRRVEIIANAFIDRIAEYNVEAQGRTINKTAKVSRLGLKDALTVAYKALTTGIELKGGITQEDITDVIEPAVNAHNSNMELYNNVAGKKVTTLDETKEFRIEELSKKELADLLE